MAQLYVLFFLATIFSCALADQKPIVVVIPSYNNEHVCIQSLDSVFAQEYEKYRVIYIDDASTDNTAQLVQEHIKACNQEHRVTFIHHNINRKQLANHYLAVHSCADHEIIVQLDGDDFFAHNGVLARINEAYQDPQVWMTYGQFQEWPSGEKGRCEQLSDVVIRNNMFRHAPWVTSHLRTFYAWLFKKIKLSDLLYDGQFFPCAADFAMMYPMLEMAGSHSRFISDVLYLYNRQNPISYFRIAQGTTAHLEIFIRGKKKYEKLGDIDITQSSKRQPHLADVIIFSENSPQQLYLCVRALLDNVSGLCSATIFYQADSDYILKGYQDMLSKMQGVHAIRYQKGNQFKQQLMQVLHGIGEHVLLVQDHTLIHRCDMHSCIEKLEATYAHAFHIHLDVADVLNRVRRVPPILYVGDGIYAWQYAYGEYAWRRPYSLHGTLYRTKDVCAHVQDLDFISDADLEQRWHDAGIASDAIGLCGQANKQEAVI